MRTRNSVISSLLWSILVLCPTAAPGQLTLSDSSLIRNKEYLEHSIQSISDKDLFKALNLGRADLRAVRSAVRTRDYLQAYRAWAAHRATSPGPRYFTASYQLLIDTEQLTDYESLRKTMASHPDERDTILARAEMIMLNRIRAWGRTVVEFDSVVDFNRDVGATGKYGFHYWGWSQPLTAAYLLTGDKRYAEKFQELFARWYEQRNSITRNIPDFDVVYYELGLGVRNRYFIEHYLLPFPERTLGTHERMLKTILGAARWLYQLELWEGYRPGNWQMHGSYMLTQAALVFPEFREASSWMSLGLQRMTEHLERDFYPDGGHSEHCPRNYTLATYGLFRNLYYLLTAYGIRPDLASKIRHKMGATIDWWLTLITPTGEAPAINDSQRGLFPVRLLEDAERFYSKPEIEGVLHSIFGVSNSPNPLYPSFTSRSMPASGFTVMRTDWSRDALYMNINHGRWSPTHTHNDILSFELYAYGRALAIDAGIGTTYDDPIHVSWYQSSRAHNMVVVNDKNLQRENHEGYDIIWDSTSTLEYFSGRQDGYASLGVRQRRQIVFVKPYYWLLLDELSCSQSGDTLSWYLHSPDDVRPGGNGWQTVASPGLVVLPAGDPPATSKGIGWAASTIDPTPGSTQQTSWIKFDRISASGSQSIFPIFLIPFQAVPPSVRVDQVSPAHYRLSTLDYTDDIFLPGGGTYEDGTLTTDAECVFLRSQKGKPSVISMIRGSFAQLNGRDLVRVSGKKSAERRFTP